MFQLDLKGAVVAATGASSGISERNRYQYKHRSRERSDVSPKTRLPQSSGAVDFLGTLFLDVLESNAFNREAPQ